VQIRQRIFKCADADIQSCVLAGLTTMNKAAFFISEQGVSVRPDSAPIALFGCSLFN